jgi:GT2 family glycosyltransferase
MATPELTVVIPAFNEERFISRQLGELRRHTTRLSVVQIIVVDNGSTDRTMQLARDAGADLVLSAKGTVGAIRNLGASHGTADVIAFMDADVFPTAQWAERIAGVVQKVRTEPMLFTGSWVSVPDECTWLERHWFKPLEHGKNTHINSGHMIVSRTLFERLRGFDGRLKTGEDFDISMRAVAAGATLHDDPVLKVIHEGYPQSVREFMRREIWHGAGDWQTLRGALSSKVALVAFVVLHGLLAGWITSAALRTLWPGLVATLIGLGLCFAASCYRYRGVTWRTRIVTTLLYLLYFISRGLSPYALMRRTGKRKPAQGARH